MRNKIRPIINLLVIAGLGLASCNPLREGEIRRDTHLIANGELGKAPYIVVLGDVLAIDEFGGLRTPSNYGLTMDSSCTRTFLSPDNKSALFVSNCRTEPDNLIIDECLEQVQKIENVSNDQMNEKAGTHLEVTIDEQCTAVKLQSINDMPDEFQPTLGPGAKK